MHSQMFASHKIMNLLPIPIAPISSSFICLDIDYSFILNVQPRSNKIQQKGEMYKNKNKNKIQSQILRCTSSQAPKILNQPQSLDN